MSRRPTWVACADRREEFHPAPVLESEGWACPRFSPNLVFRDVRGRSDPERTLGLHA